VGPRDGKRPHVLRRKFRAATGMFVCLCVCSYWTTFVSNSYYESLINNWKLCAMKRLWPILRYPWKPPKILRENNLYFRQRCEPNTSRRLTASPNLLGEMWRRSSHRTSFRGLSIASWYELKQLKESWRYYVLLRTSC